MTFADLSRISRPYRSSSISCCSKPKSQSSTYTWSAGSRSPALAGCSGPAGEEGLSRDGFDLLAKPVHVNVHHGVVGFIRRAAKSIGHEDDAEAPVDRAEHRRKHADVGFAARDYDRVDPGAAQLLVEVAAGPRGIDLLVEQAG